MTDAPKIRRVLRVREKATGAMVEYDLDLYDVFFFSQGPSREVGYPLRHTPVIVEEHE